VDDIDIADSDDDDDDENAPEVPVARSLSAQLAAIACGAKMAPRSKRRLCEKGASAAADDEESN
jgi:hypothetical protein